MRSFLRNILITFSLILLCTIGVSAAEYGELEYKVENGNVIITGVDSWYSGDIVIPSKINGKPVTKIDSYAFSCSYISSVTIPSSVKTIGNGAFYGCGDLKKVVLNKGLKTICDYAFYDCNFLESITIPSSVTSIGSYAFSRCWNLKTIAIPSGVKTIKEYTFANCDSLSKIYVPKSVTSIHEYAFNSYWTNFKGTLYYEGSLYQLDTDADFSEARILCAHSHKYKSKVTRATTTKDGKVVKTCTCGVSTTTTITKVATFTLSNTEYFYDGKVKTPTVTVKDASGKKLEKGKDYTVTYSTGRKNAGTYEVTVKLTGNYYGSRTLKFKIYSKTKSLKLSNTSLVLGVGQSKTLKAAVSPSTAMQNVTFTSSNKKVATVTAKGEITALKNGQTTITVKTGDKVVKKCVVKVYNVKLNHAKKTINVGQSLTLKPTSSSFKVVSWSSSNKKVATVDKNGVVKGVSNGKVTITAKLKNGLVLSSTITVKKASLSKKLSIYKYDSETLTLQNAAGTVTWKSSDTSVAKVSSSGTVTGISKGTAVITATCGGVKYKCTVTVKYQAAVVIKQVNWDINTADGVEPEIKICNNSSKDIKYIDIYTSYKNRFGDPAYCEIKWTDSKILTVYTGLMARTTKTFYWDPVIYNPYVSRIDIDKMVITYVDGTTETIDVYKYWYDSNYYYR